MKDIMYFLNLQKTIENGLTQEQINSKVDSLRVIDENPDISERDFFRMRKKILEEITPHRKNHLEYEKYLRYFAGMITSMTFIPKDYLKWKSEEKRNEYVSERERWKKERDQIIKEMSVPDILKSVIEKEKENLTLRKEKLHARIKELDAEIDQLQAIDDLIIFTEDVKCFNKTVIPAPIKKKLKL